MSGNDGSEAPEDLAEGAPDANDDRGSTEERSDDDHDGASQSRSRDLGQNAQSDADEKPQSSSDAGENSVDAKRGTAEPSATTPERDDDQGDDDPATVAGLAGDVVVPEDVSADELTLSPQSLNPRVRIVWIVQSLFSAAFFGAIAGVVDRILIGAGLWVGPAVFAVFAALGVVHAVLRYRVWEYEVREDALYLKRGVLTRVRTVVPYVRIQHVDASRGPLERATGLASSVVYTAGSRGADVTIPGLTAERADELQQRLKQLAIIAEGDDAV